MTEDDEIKWANNFICEVCNTS